MLGGGPAQAVALEGRPTSLWTSLSMMASAMVGLAMAYPETRLALTTVF
jgi:hypothetical protein